MRRRERAIPLRNGDWDRISRPAVLYHRELIVAPGKHAEKAIHDRTRLLMGQAVCLEVDMNRLGVLVGLWHQNETVLVKLDKHLLLRPSYLRIHANVQEPRTVLNAQRLVPRLSGFVGVVFRAIARRSSRKYDGQRDPFGYPVEEGSVEHD
jgi:hypothetical protein